MYNDPDWMYETGKVRMEHWNKFDILHVNGFQSIKHFLYSNQTCAQSFWPLLKDKTRSTHFTALKKLVAIFHFVLFSVCLLRHLVSSLQFVALLNGRYCSQKIHTYTLQSIFVIINVIIIFKKQIQSVHCLYVTIKCLVDLHLYFRQSRMFS